MPRLLLLSRACSPDCATAVLRWVVCLACAGALSGCMVSPLATRTAAFSTAAAAAVTQTQNAYQVIEQVYQDMQAARLAANYDRTPFDPAKITPLIPEEDLAVRTRVLNGLQQYAMLLAQVSGNQPVADMETQAKVLGNSLVQLHSDNFKGLKVSPEEKQIVATAVAALGGILIEHERAKALPGILEKANKPIQEICTVLQHDIGTPATPGLADALHRAYQRQMDAQQDFIRDNAKALSPEDKRREIEVLPALLRAQRNGDRMLATTSKSLADLAEAHAALASSKSSKDAPAFRIKVSELIEDANSLSAYYSSLAAPPTSTAIKVLPAVQVQ